MIIMRHWSLRVASVALTWGHILYRAHPAVWRLMARNYRPWMGQFARLHAWMTCQFAWLEVPAYREHLRRHGWDFRWFRLASYPPTDKQGYVRRDAVLVVRSPFPSTCAPSSWRTGWGSSWCG
jgi:phenylacetate-CoA ligase